MILIAFILGLTSSIHCVGMCGPIALLLGNNQKHPVQKILYHFFRILTYGGIMILLSLAGLLTQLQNWQYNLSLFSGVLLLMIAWIPSLTKNIEKFSLPQLNAITNKWLKKTKYFKGVILGVFNGLLPCAFVYAAIIIAMSYQGIFNRFGFMIIYGLGTIPLLLSMQMIYEYFPKIQKIFNQLLPIILSIIALLLILRGLGLGIPMLSPNLSPNGADGCVKMY